MARITLRGMRSLAVLRRLSPLLAMGAVTLLPSGAHAASYSRSGPFLDFATMAPLGRDHVPIRLRGGVPEVFYPFAGWQPNHITAAQYGLGEHAAWLATGRRTRLRHALSVAKWFVRTQHADGTWRYSFAFDPFGETLPVGWISAMAQGEGISLLTRAYRVTRRPAYRRSAVRALKPFLKTVANGGVVRHYAGHPWYEEYPTRSRPSFVLNGFMFSLLGLYDLAP